VFVVSWLYCGIIPSHILGGIDVLQYSPRVNPGAYNKHFMPTWQQVFAILVISLAKVVKK
jgi:hypothetical protein